MDEDKDFIRQDNNYRTLKAFQKAECIYDVTDYEDYLRVRDLEQWAYDDPRCVQTRAFCKAHLDSAIYRNKIKERSDETIANIAITLIHQCDVLIRGLIEWKKRDFLEKGGIKEEMYKARKDWQKKNGVYGKIPYDGHGYNGRNGHNGANGQNAMREAKPIQPIQPNKPSKP